MNRRPRDRRPPPRLDYSLILLAQKKRCSKRRLKTGFSLKQNTISEHPKQTTDGRSQFRFSFYRNCSLRCDFSCGQIQAG